MKRFKVWIKVTTEYTQEVDALDYDDAMLVAERNFDTSLADCEGEIDVEAVEAEDIEVE